MIKKKKLELEQGKNPNFSVALEQKKEPWAEINGTKGFCHLVEPIEQRTVSKEPQNPNFKLLETQGKYQKKSDLEERNQPSDTGQDNTLLHSPAKLRGHGRKLRGTNKEAQISVRDSDRR